MNIIANQIKPILSQHISKKQFSLLEKCQIHEIGIAQEGIHPLKVKNLKGMILKINLSKAYHRTSWLYIRILLTHLGFQYYFINCMSVVLLLYHKIFLSMDQQQKFSMLNMPSSRDAHYRRCCSCWSWRVRED